jgi:hypothetical protein
MKTLIAAGLVILLSGCVTTPVQRTFPDIPPSLRSSCEDLTLIEQGTDKLSEVLVVVTGNYAKYHECQLKVETWQQWYQTQKKIFDTVQ